jgi:hypothetical protein
MIAEIIKELSYDGIEVLQNKYSMMQHEHLLENYTE